MRLFTGIAIPEEVLERLSRLLDVLRPTGHIKWSPAYNFHITTKFIGEWPEERLLDLTATLSLIRRPGPLDITLEGLGWLPNPHSPRVLFAAIHAPPALAELAADSDRLLQERLSIPRETKPFRPHLTLARINETVPLSALRQAIANLGGVEWGRFTAYEFCLYSSQAGPEASIYTVLERFPITSQ